MDQKITQNFPNSILIQFDQTPKNQKGMDNLFFKHLKIIHEFSSRLIIQ